MVVARKEACLWRSIRVENSEGIFDVGDAQKVSRGCCLLQWYEAAASALESSSCYCAATRLPWRFQKKNTISDFFAHFQLAQDSREKLFFVFVPKALQIKLPGLLLPGSSTMAHDLSTTKLCSTPCCQNWFSPPPVICQGNSFISILTFKILASFKNFNLV